MTSQNDNVCSYIHRRAELVGVRNFEKKAGIDAGFGPRTKWVSQLNSKKNVNLKRAEVCANHLNVSLRELVGRGNIEIFRVFVDLPPLVKDILHADAEGIPGNLMAQLEETRLNNPKIVLDYISRLRQSFSIEQRAKALAILTSVFRSLLKFPEAVASFQAGCTIATAETFADLCLRARMVSMCFSRFDEALCLVQEATNCYLETNNFIRVAECQVSRAAILIDMGKPDEARVIVNQIKPMVGTFSSHQKFAYISLECRLKSGDVDTLLEASRAAREYGALAESAKLLWTAGLMSEREDYIKESIHLFPPHLGVEKAIAEIDLACFLLTKGDKLAAMEVCSSAFEKIDMTKHIPGVAQALTDISYLGYAGQGFTEARLKKLQRQLALCKDKVKEKAKRKLFG